MTCVKTLFYVRMTSKSLLKNAIFWDVAPYRCCVNRCFGGTYRLHFQGRKIRERGTSVSRWLFLCLIRYEEYALRPLCRCTHSLVGSVGLMAVLDFAEKRKSLSLVGTEPQFSVIQPVA
jgi:hypothetical protein